MYLRHLTRDSVEENSSRSRLAVEPTSIECTSNAASVSFLDVSHSPQKHHLQLQA
eukprot:CAMPEP_0202725452 /NCGR_PEP_ID=MMETSP1385-20130828/182165_1 /ASSEMBLY_ACC=CAM_ASM_000861 /TAXON_ID=933848 /ORGANISM="Elphidium margaritaceum" /LENGTH=54 /DNA_ID=CAMNT_0049391533 /DNA_START=1 /DNA_END=162 /DNA_ORIENTATION=+